jgi:hypothetical protein
MRWTGHVTFMEETRNAYRDFGGKDRRKETTSHTYKYVRRE